MVIYVPDVMVISLMVLFCCIFLIFMLLICVFLMFVYFVCLVVFCKSVSPAPLLPTDHPPFLTSFEQSPPLIKNSAQTKLANTELIKHKKTFPELNNLSSDQTKDPK